MLELPERVPYGVMLGAILITLPLFQSISYPSKIEIAKLPVIFHFFIFIVLGFYYNYYSWGMEKIELIVENIQ